MTDYQKFLYDEWQAGRIFDVARKTKLPISKLAGIARGVLPITEEIVSALKPLVSIAIREDSDVVICSAGNTDQAMGNTKARADLGDSPIEAITKAGWRACIDHIIKPNSPCPVCRVIELEADKKQLQDLLDDSLDAQTRQQAELKLHKQFMEDCSDDLECLPGCDAYGHAELCPQTNPMAAFRQLRAELKTQRELNRQLKERLEAEVLHWKGMTKGRESEIDQRVAELADMQDRIVMLRSCLRRKAEDG